MKLNVCDQMNRSFMIYPYDFYLNLLLPINYRLNSIVLDIKHVTKLLQLDKIAEMSDIHSVNSLKKKSKNLSVIKL